MKLRKLYEIAIFTVLLILNYSCMSKEKDYSDWEIGIARVSKLWEIDGSEISYEYYVAGTRYTNYIGAPIGTIFGDRFLILYNPQKPSQSIIGDPTPYFNEKDSLLTTEGKIVSTNVSIKEYKDKYTLYFRYEYYVDGNKHTRDQNTTYCVKPDNEISKGMKFRVKYVANNPQSSIMLIKDSAINVIREIKHKVT